VKITLLAAAAALLCVACAGTTPQRQAGSPALAPCPSSPNCVSSLDPDPSHRVDPLPLRGAANAGIADLKRLVAGMPRARVAAEGSGYLRAEFKSLIFRFVDDVEFLVDEAAGVIHIRSASRVGSSDLGVNRSRVEQIHRIWAAGR